jgi:hypothetical protein
MADEITRKQFLQAGAATLVVTSLGACASDDGDSEDGADSGDDGGGDCSGGATANIATNHGHDMAVAAGDITAAAAMDYDITGTADHSHTVSLTAADMDTLAAGESVSVTSSSDAGHTHQVTITC